MTTYLWIAIGGALGSVGRYWLSGVVGGRFAPFPLGTLAVNVVGSFIIGVVAALALPGGRWSGESRQLVVQFLMTGVCGGFTTFSSFSLQTLNLMREREWLHAGGNVLASVVLCLVATWLGFWIVTLIHPMKGQ